MAGNYNGGKWVNDSVKLHLTGRYIHDKVFDVLLPSAAINYYSRPLWPSA